MRVSRVVYVNETTTTIADHITGFTAMRDRDVRNGVIIIES
jgi:hypothetical protein